MFSFKTSMNNINFKATHINSINILKRDGSKYKPCEANFVEFNQENKKDLFTLKETSDLWGDCYALDIKEHFKNEDFKKENKHVYGLTTQNESYDYIKPDKVLGVVELIEKDGYNKINFLQVSPENQACQFGRPNYKKIGTAIVDSLKQIYSSKPMKLHSVFTAKDFYKKNGFKNEENSTDKLDFVWNA